MELTATHQGKALVIAPQGRLDSTTAPAFEKQLMEYLARQSNLILDFSALDFISSAGLRVLLMAAKRIGKDNGRFLLCEVSQPVREVLEISGFLGMIEVVGSRDEALAGMPS
ncbi:MAG: STAS domain-containing protein [Chromatiaceae bacterium]|nr:STAS domain-containing protein [Chromatiaceae bacterium]MBP8024158.1 STAS domain-containing protein [Chromatiaceae bacterium]MBP9602596.1 STAS domain-containing protein [Chromatiaceae bacterium]